MYKISARDIEIFAYHGVLAEEKEKGQVFLVDFDLEMDQSSLPGADDLERAVDYSLVVDAIVRIVTAERRDLLETVAGEIFDYLESIDGARSASVTVKKPHAPLPVKAGWVGVTMTSRPVD
ncbi:MAG: dihydroneopterin aldolase [Actinobacteria bacterium]|nr:dihydroneopterin aldolase [Actinomycetota bacterium]